MKIIFIALVIALTSSSLLIQEQTGSVVPESQKRDITIPSANGDPIRISYGGNAGSVNVDGKQLANGQDVVNANRHLSDTDNTAAEDEAVMDFSPKQLDKLDEVIPMTEDDVVTEKLTDHAEDTLDDPESTLLQRGNAILILLTPTVSEEGSENNDASEDQVVLTRAQSNDIKAVIALLLANIPDDALAEVQDTVPLDEVPEAVELDDDSGSDQRKHKRSRRAKALRRVRKHRAVRVRRHRAMSLKSHAVTRNHRVATTYGKKRVLRLGAPQFVRYNAPLTHNRHLMGTAAPKVEAQSSTLATDNKEVV